MKATIMRWGPLAVVVLAAIVCVLRAPPPPDARAATEPETRAMFTELAYAEKGLRRDAVKDFPTDPWSQDDAYFNLEQQRARTIATSKKVRFSDALRAVDVGMHAHLPGSEAMRKGIEPCRPRPIY
jgi:hypothetical protein